MVMHDYKLCLYFRTNVCNANLENKDFLRVTDVETGELGSHWISFGYFVRDGKVFINVYIDGKVYGQIQPL